MMKASKTAIAVALSSVFLFGCDFDVGSENKASTLPPGGDNGGGDNGGGIVVPGTNYLAQIQDNFVEGSGILRLKLSESKSDTVVDSISAGFLTVDLTYQDGVREDGRPETENAYIQFHTTDGTSNSNLRGELVLGGGNVKYRDPANGLTNTGGTYTPGDELQVKVSWTIDTFSFSINDQEYGPFDVASTSPVETISLKVGDNSGKSNHEMLADNLKIYKGDASENELIFEDDFDSGYGVGHDLNGVRYNRAEDVMVISIGGDDGGDNGDNGNGGDIGNGDDVTDNFDSYTVGTQIDVANSSYKLKGVDGTEVQAVVSNVQAKSGENSLYLLDNSTSTKGVVGREFKDGSASSGSVSTSVYIPSNGYIKSSYLYLGTDTGSSSSKRFTEVVFGSSEISIRLTDPQDPEKNILEPIVKYSKDTWVDVVINWSGDDVKVTIDGQEFSGYKAEHSENVPTAYALYNGDNSSVGTYTYFDNLNSDLF